MKKVTIIDCGLSNLLSVQHAFAHFGAETLVTGKAEDVLAADALVLPGVGAFKDGMAGLEKLGLKCDQQDVYDISIAQGHVSYTSPGAGQEVAPNSTVTLYISNGGDGSVDSSDPASDTETDTETQEKPEKGETHGNEN